MKSMDFERQRLETQQTALNSEWNIRNKKLAKLRQALAIETSANEQFKLEQTIQAEEQEIKNLERELTKIEQELRHIPSTTSAQASFSKPISSSPRQQHLDQRSLPSTPTARSAPASLQNRQRLSFQSVHPRSVPSIQRLLQQAWLPILLIPSIWGLVGVVTAQENFAATGSEIYISSVGAIAGAISGFLAGWAVHRVPSTLQWEQVLLNSISGTFLGALLWLVTVKLVHLTALETWKANSGFWGLIAGLILLGINYWSISVLIQRNRR